MVTKPSVASEYDPARLDLVERACLFIAKLLGDLMPDLRIVGGLVPVLLVDRQVIQAVAEPHCGTHDLDVGIAVGLLDEARYTEVSERLRGAGFGPDTNAQGNPTPQRWTHESFNVTVDFLIAPLADEDLGGEIRHLEHDFGAVVAPGLPLAFLDTEVVELVGRTLLDDRAEAKVSVAGPAAFVALKAFAFDLRSGRKDAYDLYYVVRHWPAGVDDIVTRLLSLLDGEREMTDDALARLQSNFGSVDHVGPRAVARFMRGDLDDDIQADVYGLVVNLLEALADRRS